MREVRRPLRSYAPAWAQAWLDRWAIDRFHQLWYDSRDTWGKNEYLGFGIKQLPLDCWLYQELVFRERPGFIVQTGISDGGSLLFFAHLLDHIGAPASAKVVGIDIELTASAKRLEHPRIVTVIHDSVAASTLELVRAQIVPGRGLVVLDSDHSEAHVAKELKMYAPLVEAGSYLVVEDTNINGHPVLPEMGPGPLEAVDAFLREHREFVRDERWKRNLISFHQGGWLRRLG
ncbi:MAG: cephalosporin hydroxylase [Myxococcales bacterium]|nr:cephalosporin hydroxylase [Myxococcales bacterium]